MGVFTFLLLVVVVTATARVVRTWLVQRAQVRRAELAVRYAEALAGVPEPERRLLTMSMPDWLDPDDPADVEAWKRARAETLRAGRG